MKEVLGYDTSSSSKDAQYEKVASSASNLNSVISSLSNDRSGMKIQVIILKIRYMILLIIL